MTPYARGEISALSGASSSQHPTTAIPSQERASQQPDLLRSCFVCPLSRQVMKDPVRMEDGSVFERSAIEHHLQAYGTHPLTQQAVAPERRHLFPVPYFRRVLEQFSTLPMPPAQAGVLLQRTFSQDWAIRLTAHPQAKQLDPLQCPITYERFNDPVLTSAHHTYEYATIVRWLSLKGVDPCTQQRVGPTLRSDIIAWHLAKRLHEAEAGTSQRIRQLASLSSMEHGHDANAMEISVSSHLPLIRTQEWVVEDEDFSAEVDNVEPDAFFEHGGHGLQRPQGPYDGRLIQAMPGAHLSIDGPIDIDHVSAPWSGVNHSMSMHRFPQVPGHLLMMVLTGHPEVHFLNHQGEVLHTNGQRVNALPTASGLQDAFVARRRLDPRFNSMHAVSLPQGLMLIQSHLTAGRHPMSTYHWTYHALPGTEPMPQRSESIPGYFWEQFSQSFTVRVFEEGNLDRVIYRLFHYNADRHDFDTYDFQRPVLDCNGQHTCIIRHGTQLEIVHLEPGGTSSRLLVNPLEESLQTMIDQPLQGRLVRIQAATVTPGYLYVVVETEQQLGRLLRAPLLSQGQEQQLGPWQSGREQPLVLPSRFIQRNDTFGANRLWVSQDDRFLVWQTANKGLGLCDVQSYFAADGAAVVYPNLALHPCGEHPEALTGVNHDRIENDECRFVVDEEGKTHLHFMTEGNAYHVRLGR